MKCCEPTSASPQALAASASTESASTESASTESASTESASTKQASRQPPLTEHSPPPAEQSTWLAIGVGALLAANSMVVGLAINISEMAPNVRLFVEIALLGATMIVALLLAGPLVQSAWAKLRQRRISFEFLFISGIVGATGASIFSMIRGAGPIYFEVASLLLVIYAIGDEVGRVSRARGIALASGWIDQNPTCRIRTCCGHEREISLSEVSVGQTVVVRPGESVPVDASVVSGESFVHESQLTGESFAAVKRPGDLVYAGSHVLDSMLVLEVTAAHGGRLVDRIAKSVEQAWARPSRWQDQADRLVRWFFPLVMAITGLTFIAWTALDGWQAGLFNGLAVLLVACPCAMGFAIPLAVWMTLGKFASSGLVSNGGDCVERLAAVDTVVFDKTGTLTDDTHRLIDLVVGEGVDRSRLMAMVAAVERTSDHPVARAFHAIDLSRDQAGAEFVVIASRYLPGRGVQATVRDRHAEAEAEVDVEVGTDELVPVEQHGTFDGLVERLRTTPGARRLAVLVDGQVAAAAAIDETPHQGVTELLKRLTQLAIEPVLMTGDRAERATPMGFPTVHAEQSPEQKHALVAELERSGRQVAFVGDGINDAAAMAASTVSISVADGSELAVGVGDITWHGSNLAVLPAAIDQARQTVSLIRKNLLYAASYNAVGITAAALGLLHPVLAAIIMVASSAFVTWHTSIALERARSKK